MYNIPKTQSAVHLLSCGSTPFVTKCSAAHQLSYNVLQHTSCHTMFCSTPDVTQCSAAHQLSHNVLQHTSCHTVFCSTSAVTQCSAAHQLSHNVLQKRIHSYRKYMKKSAETILTNLHELSGQCWCGEDSGVSVCAAVSVGHILEFMCCCVNGSHPRMYVLLYQCVTSALYCDAVSMGHILEVMCCCVNGSHPREYVVLCQWVTF
jgi:hypothetical protein